VKTTVTYESLGQSIEPGGLCDNFLIAGYCRKLFEDSHPQIWRKHCFYPKVGVFVLPPISFDFVFYILLTFIFCFQNSLLRYTFAQIDFSDFSVFYPHVPKQSNRLVFCVLISSILCAIVYFICSYLFFNPYCSRDCGIFCIKFLELWDASVDLRLLFSQFDIPNIRIILGTDLFFSKKKVLLTSLVNVLYNEVHIFCLFLLFFLINFIYFNFLPYLLLQRIDPSVLD
jgi:hypothetical protein